VEKGRKRWKKREKGAIKEALLLLVVARRRAIVVREEQIGGTSGRVGEREMEMESEMELKLEIQIKQIGCEKTPLGLPFFH